MNADNLDDLRNLVLTAPMGIAIVDAETLIIEMVNDIFMEVSGKPYEAVFGKHHWEAFAEAAPFYESKMAYAIREGQPVRGDSEEIMLVRQGRKESFYINFVFMPLKNSAGQVRKLVVWVLENTGEVKKQQAVQELNEELNTVNEELRTTNTELVETQFQLQQSNDTLEEKIVNRTQELSYSEARLRGIFEQAPLAFCILRGKELIIEMANERMLALWGTTSAVIGQAHAAVRIEPEAAPFLKILDGVYATGVPFTGREVKAYTATGNKNEWGYFSFTYQPIREKGGQITGILAMVDDVTEEVKYRKEAERVSEQLALAVNAARIGTWNIHPDTKALQYNATLADIFGYEGLQPMTYEEAIGQVTEEYRLKITKEIEQAIADGGDYNITYTQRRFNDDQLIWLNSSGKIVVNLDNNSVAFSGVVVDITEQVEAKKELQALNEELAAINEELKTTNEELIETQNHLLQSNATLGESETRFRTMAESTDIMISINDAAGNAEYLNKAWLSFLGQPPQQMLAYGWGDRLYPDDKERMLRQYAAGIPTKAAFDMEFRILNKNNEPRWMYTKINPRLLSDGSYAGTISSTIDITERKRHQEELQEVNSRLNIAIDAGSFGSTEVDLATGSMICNAQFKKLFGRREDESFTYPQMFEAMLPQYRENVRDRSVFARENHTIYEAEYEVAWPDESVHWISAHGMARYDSEGKAIKMIGILADITENKRDEQRKNDFINMVSHELKTPITSLNGYIQLLQLKAEKMEDTFTISSLDKAKKQVDKMTTMINGFLNMSRLESGKIHIEKTRFDMAGLIKEAEEEVIASINSHKVRFAPVQPTFVLADRDKIGHVISNLISNAIKYSPSTSVVSVACITKGGMAEVSVRDEGIGIKPEDISKLFDRYYRVDGDSTISGFGIGLYLCKEIIDRHNGTIRVESEPGKGSTFYFTLLILE